MVLPGTLGSKKHIRLQVPSKVTKACNSHQNFRKSWGRLGKDTRPGFFVNSVVKHG